MTAAEMARAFGGHRAGGTWMARCPAHDDREPSLALRDGDDGRVLVCCHAGCPQDAVIDALAARGLWAGRCMLAAPGVAPPTAGSRSAPVAPEADDFRRTEAALAIWQSARPTDGTLVEVYLRSRGLRIVPASLRFHPGLRHSAGGVWPAMIGLVVRGTDGIPTGIHRTFLAANGSAKAPVVPQKMMLGRCRGGAVRLADAGPDDTMIMVGEGIETCLAAMQATGRPAWAALSTSGLRSLDLPAAITEVIILADGDEPGEAAARDAARRWVREGRRVRIARPPRGQDFNDMLLAGLPAKGSP